MKTKKRQINIHVTEQLYDKIKQLAVKETANTGEITSVLDYATAVLLKHVAEKSK
jgi:hypothetical protein